MLCALLVCLPVQSQSGGSTPRDGAQASREIPLREVPQLTRITPDAAAASTRIKIEGLRLGANLDEGVRVIFVQGSAEYSTGFSGSENDTDLEHGEQALNVAVPEELQTGSCSVIVEVSGQRSAPLPLKIKAPATPPVLSGLRPLLPQPGETIWVDGTGFSESDDFELSDSLGKAHHIINGHGTSDADCAAFTLPEDFPAGETTLRAIEHRSGSSQFSNTLSFRVVRGPAPLDVWGDELMPVAPGQWLDLVVTSEMPSKDAERVEVSFRQENQVLLAPLEDSRKLRVQVPSALNPGHVEIQTRTWAAGEASPWSAPVNFSLLEKPVASKVGNLEIRPVRVEAGFKQADHIVAISSVADADYPRVRVPTDKLSPGLVGVETRVWRGGQPSAWLSKGYGFNWPSKFLPDGTMGEVPFMEGIYIGHGSPGELVVYPGEGLILGGTFPVASAEKLRVTLECAGHPAITLNPITLPNPRSVRINLPEDLASGDWDVTVSNDNAAVKLATRLRIKAQ